MILGQLRMGARQTKNAPLFGRGAGGQTDKRPFRSSSLRLLRSIDILNCQQKGARRNSSEELSNLKQPFRNQDQNK